MKAEEKRAIRILLTALRQSLERNIQLIHDVDRMMESFKRGS